MKAANKRKELVSKDIYRLSFRLFVSAYLILLFVSLLLVVKRRLEGVAFPKNSFVNDRVTWFGDFYIVFSDWNNLGFEGVSYGLSYLPAAYVIPELLKFLEPNPYRAVTIFLVAAVFLLILTLKNIAREQKIEFIPLILISLSSYPFLISLSTANNEIVSVVLVLGAVYYLQKNKINQSSIMLGLASSMKLIPLIFTIMYFVPKSIHVKKRVKALTISLATAITANLAALIFLPTGVIDEGTDTIYSAYANWKASSNLYEELMLFSGAGNHFGHSLLTGFRVIFEMTLENGQIWPYFFSFLVLLGNLVAVFVAIRCKGNLYEILSITAITMSLSLPVSQDYRLLYFSLFVGLFIFSIGNKLVINDKRKRLLLLGDSTLLIIIALILAPKPWGYLASPYINASVWLTPILLVLAQILLLSRVTLLRESRT